MFVPRHVSIAAVSLSLFGVGCGPADLGTTYAAFDAPLIAKLGAPLTLSASNEIGGNGEALTYRWTLETPVGSAAALDRRLQQAATFTPDMYGEFFVTLVVDDGDRSSNPITHTIEIANAAPVAQTILLQDADLFEVGQEIRLDASQSADCDSDPLTYSWYFDHVPPGSAAAMADPTGMQPTFVPDVAGLYAPRLIVNDGSHDSEPHGVFINAVVNNAPVANAGLDRDVAVSAVVELDSAESFDVDPHQEDPLVRTWQLAERPPASAAQLANQDQVTTEFVADVAGFYVIELFVTDRFGSTSETEVIVVEAR